MIIKDLFVWIFEHRRFLLLAGCCNLCLGHDLKFGQIDLRDSLKVLKELLGMGTSKATNWCKGSEARSKHVCAHRCYEEAWENRSGQYILISSWAVLAHPNCYTDSRNVNDKAPEDEQGFQGDTALVWKQPADRLWNYWKEGKGTNNRSDWDSINISRIEEKFLSHWVIRTICGSKIHHAPNHEQVQLEVVSRKTEKSGLMSDVGGERGKQWMNFTKNLDLSRVWCEFTLAELNKLNRFVIFGSNCHNEVKLPSWELIDLGGIFPVEFPCDKRSQ